MLAFSRKRNGQRKRQTRRRSSHLMKCFFRKSERALYNEEEELKSELYRVESADSRWSHPTGFSFLSSLRIINAACDPVYLNTGHWIQPEDVNDIPAMLESYLNVNCLYYSLVGILAVEIGINMESPPEDSPTSFKLIIAVSKFCWAANGLWSLAAVVTSFHIIWAVHATPAWALRKFLFENSSALSIVYALGAPNFALLLVGTVTGLMGHVLLQPDNTYDLYATIAGLSVSLIVTFTFVMTAGNLISKIIRPWKIARDELDRKREENHNYVDSFVDDFNQNGDLDYNMRGTNIDIDASARTAKGIDSTISPQVSQKLCDAGLDLETLRKVNNELLLDQLLQGAGVELPGERLELILYVRDTSI